VAKPKKPPPSETPSPEKLPPSLTKPSKDSVRLTPWTVLQAALKAFPPLKVVLGVLGVVSASAIIKGFGIDFRVAVFGTIIMLVLMTSLVVFASLTKVKKAQVAASS
jgi:hypothetical protein